MLDYESFKENDTKHFIVYRQQKCPFIPERGINSNNFPNDVPGWVLYIEEGEYCPNSWLKRITVSKNDITR